MAQSFWPKRFTNVEVRFTIKEVGLGFRCDDMGVGRFRVWVFDESLEDLVYMEGKNQDGTVPTIGFDFINTDSSVLKSIFHMARCRRELERTGEIGMALQYKDHRDAVVKAFRKQTAAATPTL